ncbi:MAG: hypothetical protein LKK51_00620 [Eubacterium sp.]|jgi:hypothetical protein|nr:hypothetical protein [Eubacterium sp.]
MNPEQTAVMHFYCGNVLSIPIKSNPCRILVMHDSVDYLFLIPGISIKKTDIIFNQFLGEAINFTAVMQRFIADSTRNTAPFIMQRDNHVGRRILLFQQPHSSSEKRFPLNHCEVKVFRFSAAASSAMEE